MKNKQNIVLIILTIIISIYSIFSFFNLGTTNFPTTSESFKENEEIVLELTNETDISFMTICSGYNILNYEIYVSTDNNFEYLTLNENKLFFHWEKIDINQKVKFIKIKFKQYEELPPSFNKKIYDGNVSYINEIGIFDSNENKVDFITEYKNLKDEQTTVVKNTSVYNSAYFDEFYFTKAGYQYANGIIDGEIDQPPLGKEIISVGIKIFGMNPFGWRCMGCLAGIFMLSFIFLLAKELFNEKYALLATLLLALDFMHFSQTRIGTIDSFAVLSLIACFYFIIKVLKDDNTNRNLFLSGLCLGIGCAIKIYCAYAIPALALFLIYKFLEKQQKSSIDAFVFLLCSILSYVFIPLLINILSFIPYFSITKSNISLMYIFNFYKDMFLFHSNSVSTHAFQSEWWQWLFNYKPMLYYGTEINGIYELVASFGNPIIWLTGIISIIFSIVYAFKYKNEKAWFILLIYVSLLFPWLLISRMTFIYHYFSCTIFMILSIVFMFFELSKIMNKKHFYWLITLFLITTFLLLCLYYPILSGMPISIEYLRKFLIFYPFLNF